jgi:YD repeat-containing protein
VIEEENELADSRLFSYEAASRLVARTDGLGRVREFDYDDLHRLVEVK